MKCICGYEKGTIYTNDNEMEAGDENFIKLNVAFLRDNSYRGYESEPSPSTLYACPKCGTVKVDYP
jgi:hypothetical protein